MTVKQIQNALDLLEYFAQIQRPASLAEIQQHFGWPRSSTHNILSTFSERGYLYEPTRRGGYYPTPKWQRLADTIVDADPLNQHLAELIDRLARETGETAMVAATAGRYSVYLKVVESAAPIRYAGYPGARIPIHASASGRALLSLYPVAERNRILQKIKYEQYGTNALMSKCAVEEEIAISLERGWFQSLHEYDADLAAVAVPVTIDGRHFAITIAGPIFRLGDRCGEVAALLKSQVEESFGQPTRSVGL